MTDDLTPGSPEPGREHWVGALAGYERLTIIGRGGTATVYSATRSEDGTPVAIKVFDPAEPRPFERQLRAAQLLRDLPGVVSVDEHGTLPDDRGYLVFPYAPGGSLSDHLQRFGAMPPERVAWLGAQLASSLHSAHQAGVLHRDLKPSNILIGEDGSPLLADFGAATAIEPDTVTETMAVTILYAAPEVLQGANATERSDVYSLGLTLLALCMGTHPFGGPGDSGLAALIDRICTVGPPDPSDLGVPAGLAAVLRRATSLDPDERYADAGALASALVSVTDHLDVAPPGSRPRRTGPPAGRRGSQRSRRLVAAAGIVAVGAVAGAIAWSQRGDDSGAAATTTTEPGTTTTTISTLGPPVTEADGVLGALYQQDDFAYAGQLTEECGEDDRRVALSIHADQEDRKAGVAEPWVAVKGENAGTFMAYLPCESGGRNIRYVLRAPGRWFTVVAQFPQDQYDRMVEWMRENETSPAPDYTVDDPIRATLAEPGSYEGWAIIDRAE